MSNTRKGCPIEYNDLIKGDGKNRYGGLKKKAKLVGGVGEKKGKLASIT